MQSNSHKIFEDFSYFINRFPKISHIIQQYTCHRACYLNIVLLKISIKIIYLIWEIKILNYTRHNYNYNYNNEYESKRLLMK